MVKRGFSVFLILCLILQASPALAGGLVHYTDQAQQSQQSQDGLSLLGLDAKFDDGQGGAHYGDPFVDPKLYEHTDKTTVIPKDEHYQQLPWQDQQQQAIVANPDTKVHNVPNPSSMFHYGHNWVICGLDEWNAWAHQMNQQQQQQQKQQQQQQKAHQQQQRAHDRQQARVQQRRRPHQDQSPWGPAPKNEMDLQYRQDLMRWQLERERLAHEQAMWQAQQQAQQQAQERQWQMHQEQIRRQEEEARRRERQERNLAVAQMFGMMIPMIVVASQGSSRDRNTTVHPQPYPPYQQFPHQQKPHHIGW